MTTSHRTAPPPKGASPAAVACRSGAPARRCIHCNLPLTRSQQARNVSFCCGGCEVVHALIHEKGLDRYYELRGGQTTAPPGASRPDGFAWVDRVLEAEDIVPGRPRMVRLDIQGVRCAACVWLLQTLFRRSPGALDVRINPALGTADLTWIEGAFDPRPYFEEALSFGYRFGPSAKERAPRARGLVIRMGLAIALAMNTMIFSLCFYLGLAPGDGALYTFIGALTAILATLSVAAGGWVFMRDAWLCLRRRVAHLDLPIALGIILAYAGSMAVYLTRGPEAAYFDTVTAFVALMLVGRWLQERVLERNRAALLADGGAAGLLVRRVRAGVLEVVPVSSLAAGDEIRVVPGDLVPVRARLDGRGATLSLDWITGESAPVQATLGDEIPAGAINAGDRALRLVALEPFESSRLDRLLATSVNTHAGHAQAGARFWSRLASGYVVAVLALAALGFLAWAGTGVNRALEVTVTILVVTCPCALGIALPLGRELVQEALRRRGVFIRTSDLLDRALLVRHVLFDKTGTLTLDRLRLTDAARARLAQLAPEHRAALHLMVAHSNHPASRAVALVLDRESKALKAPADGVPEERAGSGLALTYGGRTYLFGRSAFARGGTCEPSTAHERGDVATCFSLDGRVLASFDFEEEIRPDAKEEVARLREVGYDVRLLSGDRPEQVARAARRLGVPESHALGGLTPEKKAAIVAELDHNDTLMVGDGINDAPGFEVAFCSATPAIDRATLPGRADFYFLGEGIAAVRLVLESAQRLRRVARANLAFALAYNAGALTLCFLGLVTPVMAAILMPASSIAVVTATTFRLSGRRLEWMS